MNRTGNNTFSNLRDLALKEPALIRGVVIAIFALLASLGLVHQEHDVAGITSGIIGLISFLALFDTRGKVYNETTVDNLLEKNPNVVPDEPVKGCPEETKTKRGECPNCSKDRSNTVEEQEGPTGSPMR